MKTIRKARLTPRRAVAHHDGGPGRVGPGRRLQPGRAGAASDAKQQATATAVAPPDVRTVMHTIYQVDGQGKDSYEVANGSVATWYGHAFELNGTRYFTGFTWDTRERYGKPGEDDAGPTPRSIWPKPPTR